MNNVSFLRRKPRVTELMKEGQGKLTDQSYDEAELAMALAGLPAVTAS